MPSNPYDQASSLLNSASSTYQTMGSEGSLGNINNYVNPYYQQVLDAALGRMGTNYQQGMDGIGDRAQAAGAYGGSRHGVAEGVYTGEYNKNVGDVSANVMHNGYTDAANRATADQLNSAQGMTQLGNNMYQIGNDLTDRQMAQGTNQQSMLQTILGQGSGMFDQYMQNPYQMIDLFSSLLNRDARNANGTQTTTSTPGLFDYLSLGAQAYGG